jgi:hypothetical protein
VCKYPSSYLDPSVSLSAPSSWSASSSDSGPASIEKFIKRLENEIEDLRAEKARLTDVVETFPPIIRDLGDEIRKSHAEGPGRWEGDDRRRQSQRVR